MRIYFIVLLIIIQNIDFKDQQLKYSRVRNAYKEKEVSISNLLIEKKLERDSFQIYIQAFKHEKQLEVWAKNTNDKKFTKLITYNICMLSGQLGPKRKMGDLQIPEGFYYISKFNPFSNFHLSLEINYPNLSDKILGHKTKPGGDIFIHGNCVTIGCIPITDDKIKEFYIFCIEAANNGQDKIPVHIYPAKLNNTNFTNLTTKYVNEDDKINLWIDLKKSYDYFKTNKTLPKITFLNSGRHTIESTLIN